MPTIEEKTQKFKQLVLQSSDPKFKPYLNEFIAYWTEPNKTGTKIRYDGERFFHVNRRLATWSARNIQIKGAEVVSEARKKPTGKLQQMNKDELIQAYNGEREGKYVHIKYFDVYNFLAKKGVIPNGKDRPYTEAEKKYFAKVKYNAQGLIYARLIDRLKKLEGKDPQAIEQRLKAVKEGRDHEIGPQCKALVLTDIFDKYSLEELLNKTQ